MHRLAKLQMSICGWDSGRDVGLDSEMESLLVRLAHQLLDEKQYGFVENISNFLHAVNSGQWVRLPNDEKHFRVQKISGMLGSKDGLASHASWSESELLRQPMKLLYQYERGLKRLTES